MKILLALFPVLFICQISFSQGFLEEGGGEYIVEKEGSCLSAEQRTDIQSRLISNKISLQEKGILPESNSEMIVLFDWPMKKAAGFNFNSYYRVTNFVDHDPVATGTQYGASNLDYFCGNRTYDTSNGYNHSGIDYATWPFPWYMYDNNLVEVIAGAAGTIIGKDDGNADQNCSCNGNWNGVYVQHGDGSVAWYGHMKKNLLTSKAVGQTVSAGEYLGIVASSGCSSAPHLHFEVYDNNNNLIDPYAGNCNNMNSNSWWASQPAYREPTVNTLLTHDAVPVHGCPGVSESPIMQNVFYPGQTVYTAAYYHDQLVNDISNYKIRRPDNSIWQNWSHTSPNTYSSSWWYWTWSLPTNGPFGAWTFEVEFHGNTITHNFIYADPSTCVDDGDCTNGIETWNTATCVCEQLNIPDPSGCIDDGDCSNGVENWNTTICSCEQLNIPNPSTCVDDGDCTNGIETWNSNTCICEQLNIPNPPTYPANITISSDPANFQLVEASNSIITSGNVNINTGYNVEFKAGVFIDLNVGFHAKSNSEFLAHIDNCGSTTSPFVSDENLEIEKNDLEKKEVLEVANKQEDELKIEIFPNPSTGIFSITGNTNATIEIINSVGGVSVTRKINSGLLDILDLPSGVYFLIFNEKTNPIIRKIIKL